MSTSTEAFGNRATDVVLAVLTARERKRKRERERERKKEKKREREKEKREREREGEREREREREREELTHVFFHDLIYLTSRHVSLLCMIRR
jgi:sRNA-binding protein